MRRNVVVYFILTFFVTFDPSTLEQDVETIANNALKFIGYDSEQDVEDWKQAFKFLANYNALYIDLLKSNLSTRIREKDRSKCESDCWIYKASMGALKLRSDHIENIEKFMHIDFIFRDSKAKMMEELQNTKTIFYYKELFTTKVVDQIRELEAHTDIHTVEWLYYLAFFDSMFANSFRTELIIREVNVYEFCVTVGQIFSKVSLVIHNPVTTITIPFEKIVQGLSFFGVKSRGINATVRVLMKVPEYRHIQLEKSKKLLNTLANGV